MAEPIFCTISTLILNIARVYGAADAWTSDNALGLGKKFCYGFNSVCGCGLMQIPPLPYA